MSSLIEIRKKVESVKNTGKMTKAMQLVATSKMKFFQKKALNSRLYALKLLKIFYQVFPHQEEGNSFSTLRKEGPTLFVLYTSDKGLCGSLNSQMIRTLFKSNQWTSKASEEKLLITIGRKAHDFAQSNKIPLEKSYQGIPENLNLLKALPFIDNIFNYWTENKCREVVLVVPHYKTAFTFYPVLKTFLPFRPEEIYKNLKSLLGSNELNESIPKFSSYLLFEPDRKRVMEVMYRHIIQSEFLHVFFELKAVEYASRMIAMQNSTEAAKKIIHQLTLSYNKIRQQLITQELAELIGASDVVS